MSRGCASLGVLERAEHPVGVHLELGAMPFDERRERCGVAGRRRCYQLLVEPDRRHCS
jgi:hypothetical protein